MFLSLTFNRECRASRIPFGRARRFVSGPKFIPRRSLLTARLRRRFVKSATAVFAQVR